MRFCDECGRSLGRGDREYETPEGRVVCAACRPFVPGAFDRRAARLIEARRRKRRIAGAATAAAMLAALLVAWRFVASPAGETAPERGGGGSGGAESGWAPSVAVEGESDPDAGSTVIQRMVYETARAHLRSNAPPSWSDARVSTLADAETRIESEGEDAYRVTLGVWPDPADPAPVLVTFALTRRQGAWIVARSLLDELEGALAGGDPADAEPPPSTGDIEGAAAGEPRDEASRVGPEGAAVAATDAAADAPGDRDRDPIPESGPAPVLLAERFAGRYALRLRRNAAPDEARQSVEAALDWLMRHQARSGAWEARGFSASCAGAACDGGGASEHTIGVTGLALLAFLGAGHTADQGPYRDVVRAGLDWLAGRQDPDSGRFGHVVGGRVLAYDHAIATLAVTEGAALSDDRVLRQVAARGLRFIHEAQGEDGGFRYHVPPQGPSDISVTGWMAAALRAGRDFGHDVDPERFERMRAFVDALTDPDTGRAGYLERGGYSAREAGDEERWPVTETEAMTASALSVRLAAGERPEGDPSFRRGISLLEAKAPRGFEHESALDFYYWFFAAHALREADEPAWEEWRGALVRAVCPAQRTRGCAAGSWDPLGPWGRRGGRVYATAILALALEAHDRFDPSAPLGLAVGGGSAAGVAVPAVAPGLASRTLQRLLDRHAGARGELKELEKVAAALRRYAADITRDDRSLALLFAGYALAEAGDLERPEDVADRIRKYTEATQSLRECMAVAGKRRLADREIAAIAARLRLTLHELCLAHFGRRRGTDGYSEARYRRDTAWHARGVEECEVALEGGE